VASLAEIVARRLGVRELEALRLGGALHDLGKLAVPQRVLLKPTALTPSELARIREHPSAGTRLLAPIEAVRSALPYVLFHHERWDGDGYPTGRAGAAIPLGARVLAVVDAFDAMTSDRPYRRALGVVQALAELRKGAGTQFDGEVVGTLLRLHASGQFPIIPSPSSEDLRLLKPLRARG
jgi:putative two-component system response regulator